MLTTATGTKMTEKAVHHEKGRACKLTIVVDTWAGLHRVGVAADDEDGVLVAADSLCDDVFTIMDD